MADVDMTDAPSGSSSVSKVGKSKGSEGEGKKRFEVKKVSAFGQDLIQQLLTCAVECSGIVGLGYCRRQLCHLPESYHGSLYVTGHM